MHAIVQSFLLAYAALFPIVNPLGGAPLFLGITQFCTDEQRRLLAFRVSRNSFLLLLGAVFIGSHILEFFGIELAALRVAGGLVVTVFGWRLLNSGLTTFQDKSDDAVQTIPDSFYPLTLPLTVGPGSLAVAITLGAQRPRTAGLEQLALLGSGLIAGILAMAVTIFVCYRFADRVMRLIGPSGVNVVVRMSAFILMCIGIQILWSGWTEFVASAPSAR